MTPPAPQPCPWDGHEPAALHWCERELCAWIEQPANTWSNLAYVIVGVAVWRLALSEHKRPLAVIGAIEVLIAFGSFYFHASSTYLGEVMDVCAMFLFSGYWLVFNLWRFHDHPERWSPTAYALTFAAIVVGSTAVLVVKNEIGTVIFALIVAAALALEVGLLRASAWRARWQPRRQVSSPAQGTRPAAIYYRDLALLGAAFAFAWTVWWLDFLKIVCDPDNHVLQGHAVWHCVNSLCFYFLYRFNRQFLPARV